MFFDPRLAEVRQTQLSVGLMDKKPSSNVSYGFVMISQQGREDKFQKMASCCHYLRLSHTLSLNCPSKDQLTGWQQRNACFTVLLGTFRSKTLSTIDKASTPKNRVFSFRSYRVPNQF